VAGSQLWWDVRLSPRVRLKEFDRHWEEALRLHEQHGVTEPSSWFPDGVVEQSHALQWFEANGVSMFGFANITDDPQINGRQPGAVRVRLEGRSGAVGSADIVPQWFSEQTAVEGQIKSKLDKLAASGYGEQHLFLVVHHSAEPFSFAWIVGDEEELPTAAPVLGSATHVWLVPMFGLTYLTWSRDAGWKRRRIPKTEETN
jgi:hypothetical protein